MCSYEDKAVLGNPLTKWEGGIYSGERTTSDSCWMSGRPRGAGRPTGAGHPRPVGMTGTLLNSSAARRPTAVGRPRPVDLPEHI